MILFNKFMIHLSDHQGTELGCRPTGLTCLAAAGLVSPSKPISPSKKEPEAAPSAVPHQSPGFEDRLPGVGLGHQAAHRDSEGFARHGPLRHLLSLAQFGSQTGSPRDA